MPCLGPFKVMRLILDRTEAFSHLKLLCTPVVTACRENSRISAPTTRNDSLTARTAQPPRQMVGVSDVIAKERPAPMDVCNHWSDMVCRVVSLLMEDGGRNVQQWSSLVRYCCLHLRLPPRQPSALNSGTSINDDRAVRMGWAILSGLTALVYWITPTSAGRINRVTTLQTMWNSSTFPWRFAALLRGTRHVKCYSYHPRTSSKYLLWTKIWSLQ